MHRAFAFIGAAVAALASGCSTVRVTEPARTATEQLLISTAADRATAQLEMDNLAGKKVFLVDARFDGYDKPYAISLLEDRLLRLGALIVKKAGDAQVVVEIRSGALSTDHDTFLIGIPALTVPIPMAGA